MNPCTDLPRDIALSMQPGWPVYTGHCVVIGMADGTQVALVAATPHLAKLAAEALSGKPSQDLDPKHIYNVGIVARSTLKTKGDEEEL